MEKENSLLKQELSLDGKDVEIKSETFEKLMFLYSAALKKVETEVDILKDEFKYLYNYTLIDHVTTRIKKPESILNKMKKKKCNMNYQNLIEEISDVAGLRIICPVKDDVFSIVNLIKSYPEFKVLKEKDYITKPKRSGYSSYHLIIDVPVNVAGKIIYVKVEIQVRTMAMDFWASLEHEIKYKTDKKITKKMSKELIQCAKLINKMDLQMTNMAKR